jgi:hypothetical protein
MLTRNLLVVFFAGCFLATIGCQRPSGAQSSVKGDSATVPAGSTGIEIPKNLEKTGELVKLQFSFRKGDVFGYSISNFEKVKISRDTNTDVSDQKVVYRYKFEVLEPFAEGGARLQVTCMGVQFNGHYKDVSGSREMKYDSDMKNDRDKQKVFAQYNAPVNTPFEIVVDHDGKIAAVRNLDAVVRRYMGDDYNSTKAEQRRVVELNYGESGLKKIIQLAFQKVENKSLGIDSSWTIFLPESIGFLKIQNVATYTLKGFQKSVAGKLAHIAVHMKSEYVGAKKLDTGQGWATISGFNVEGKGTSVFNMDKMRVASRALRQTIYTKFYIEPPEELKKVAPDQAKNFFMVQEASVDNTIEELHF